MRSISMRRMAEEMAVLKRSSADPSVKRYFEMREKECLDRAEREEQSPTNNAAVDNGV